MLNLKANLPEDMTSIMKSIELNDSSGEPLYVQVRDQLRSLIVDGTFQVGDQFPGDQELVKIFSVGRVTVRQAISDLVDEGLLYRRAGKGTFVSTPKINRELINVASYTSRMQHAGLSSSAKLLSREVVQGDRDLATRLAAPFDTKILHLRRLRYTGTEPTSIEDAHLSLDRYPELEHFKFEHRSLYQFLETEYNERPHFAHRILDLTYATPEESQILGITRGAPLFLLRATVRSESGLVMEYVKIRFRADRFRFEV